MSAADTREGCRALTTSVAVVDGADIRFGISECIEDFSRIVRTAVINQNDLKTRGRQDHADLVNESADVLRLVEQGNDDRKIYRACNSVA